MIEEKKLIEKIEKMVIPLSTPDGRESIDIGINGYNECLVDVLETIKEQPKVGEWIPIKGNEPSCNGQYLMFVRIYNKYGSEDKYIVADYYDGLFDVYPYIEVENCEVEVLAWQPLPEPYKGETE